MLRIDASRLGELSPRFVDMRGYRQLVTFGELGDAFEQSLGAALRSRGTERPMKPRRQRIQPFDLQCDECNVSLRVARLTGHNRRGFAWYAGRQEWLDIERGDIADRN